LKIRGEFQVFVDGRRVTTAREVSFGESWEADPAEEVRWWLPEPEPYRVPNRHDRRRAAALARKSR